jgi:hypothetical protein
MGEKNSPSVAHVGYDISPLSRVRLKKLTTHLFQNLKLMRGKARDILIL